MLLDELSTAEVETGTSKAYIFSWQAHQSQVCCTVNEVAFRGKANCHVLIVPLARLNVLTVAEYVLNLHLFSSAIGFYICRKVCAYGKRKEKVRIFFYPIKSK